MALEIFPSSSPSSSLVCPIFDLLSFFCTCFYYVQHGVWSLILLPCGHLYSSSSDGAGLGAKKNDGAKEHISLRMRSRSLEDGLDGCTVVGELGRLIFIRDSVSTRPERRDNLMIMPCPGVAMSLTGLSSFLGACI